MLCAIRTFVQWKINRNEKLTKNVPFGPEFIMTQWAQRNTLIEPCHRMSGINCCCWHSLYYIHMFYLYHVNDFFFSLKFQNNHSFDFFRKQNRKWWKTLARCRCVHRLLINMEIFNLFWIFIMLGIRSKGGSQI